MQRDVTRARDAKLKSARLFDVSPARLVSRQSSRDMTGSMHRRLHSRAVVTILRSILTTRARNMVVPTPHVARLGIWRS